MIEQTDASTFVVRCGPAVRHLWLTLLGKQRSKRNNDGGGGGVVVKARSIVPFAAADADARHVAALVDQQRILRDFFGLAWLALAPADFVVVDHEHMLFVAEHRLFPLLTRPSPLALALSSFPSSASFPTPASSSTPSTPASSSSPSSLMFEPVIMPCAAYDDGLPFAAPEAAALTRPPFHLSYAAAVFATGVFVQLHIAPDTLAPKLQRLIRLATHPQPDARILLII